MAEVQRAEGREHEPDQVSPRIYVASLSDYNAGRLHGVWLDAATTVENLQEGIDVMLAKSSEPGAEEWAIHDYEGFGPVRLDEYEPLDVISDIGSGVAEHGPAFAAWAALSTDSDHLEQFEDCYLGEYESMTAYAEDVLDDLGVEQLLDDIPEGLRPYITVDAEGFSRDLELSSDVTVSETSSNSVYIFTNRW